MMSLHQRVRFDKQWLGFGVGPLRTCDRCAVQEVPRTIRVVRAGGMVENSKRLLQQRIGTGVIMQGLLYSSCGGNTFNANEGPDWELP